MTAVLLGVYKTTGVGEGERRLRDTAVHETPGHALRLGYVQQKFLAIGYPRRSGRRAYECPVGPSYGKERVPTPLLRCYAPALLDPQCSRICLVFGSWRISAGRIHI
ncbi:hypothetical protein BDN71DRAFT_1199099 [Pleurotus eryngii]|uniref:Uncharacterized protein n=1 Tax=Pleurotus eryngii TaxID=5323 RepID=A0A9P6D4N7_PLEER|nr:hypothetical protein BDN71DRAFT_1199099 [Pleurotus eryngii]